MAYIDELLEEARAADLAVWNERDQLVVRGPAAAESLVRALHEQARDVLMHLGWTDLGAVFPGPDGPPSKPCCRCGSMVRLHRPEPYPGWLLLDCACGHRCPIKLADYADWRLRQLRDDGGLTPPSHTEVTLHDGTAQGDDGVSKASVKRTCRWSDLGDVLPEEGAYPPPHEPNRRVIEVRDTALSVGNQTCGDRVIERAEYTCAHARVRVNFIHDLPLLDRQVLPRMALALHAWGFNCNCFRIDWEAVIGQPPTRPTLTSARQWALDIQRSQRGCWVEFAVRLPAEPAPDMKATESSRMEPEAAK